MKTNYTYYKNSNTGELIMKQHFSGVSFDCPDCFYNVNKNLNDVTNLIGFIEISEKKFEREVKRNTKFRVVYKTEPTKINNNSCCNCHCDCP
jgi:hypothetical protein